MKTSFEKNRDIVISTRVRLARNLRDMVFPLRMSPEQAEEMIDRLSRPLLAHKPDGFTLTRLTGDNRLEAQAMVEQHLISPELAAGHRPRGVVLSEDNRLSVMLGEEDHVRIQALGTGLCLEECLQEALRVDELLDHAVEYAFDESLGYLTSCPTNLGTGLRASVMLHLPVLTGSGGMRDIVTAAGKMGLAVRGLYGEGSEASGALYQVSNQTTLGLTEEEIVSRVNDVALHMIAQERALRLHFRKQQPSVFDDRAWRAWGLLKHARRLSGEEGMRLLSDLRLGVSGGMLTLPMETLDALLQGIQPGVLSLAAEHTLSAEERDTVRADYVRKTLEDTQV